jgi:hypothetical protein
MAAEFKMAVKLISLSQSLKCIFYQFLEKKNSQKKQKGGFLQNGGSTYVQ